MAVEDISISMIRLGLPIYAILRYLPMCIVTTFKTTLSLNIYMVIVSGSIIYEHLKS